MTSVTGNYVAPSVDACTDIQAPGCTQPPELLDVCGLLTIQLGMRPDDHEAPQLEEALRTINGTEIGAKLLRNIAACDIPPRERPAFVFECDDPNADSTSAFEYPALTGAYIIHFNISRGAGTADAPREPAPDVDGEDPQITTLPPGIDRAVDLFSSLTAFYASRMGESSPAPRLGFGQYSVLTFGEQLGMDVPQWQHDVEAWIQAPAADPEERRADIWDPLCEWEFAEDFNAPLMLAFMGLRECPPLQNLPGLETLSLAGNRISAVPDADRLPPSVIALDLAGNPISAGAKDYRPRLTQITLDGSCFEGTNLGQAFPARLAIIKATQSDVDNARRLLRFQAEFPETRSGLVPVEEMERAGWTNETMRELYPKDLLENAVHRWLAPGTPTASWRRAQELDPNAAAAMSQLLDRLYSISEGDSDSNFRGRLVALLNKMQQAGKEQFRDQCLAIARNGAESCRDRILDTLNDLHIASLNDDAEAGDYDARVIELLHHGEDMFTLHTLAQFTSGLMPELARRARERGQTVDEVEQFLVLQTRLQEKVYLPALQFKMHFDNLSVITSDDVELATASISKARQTEYIAFLGAWSPLQSVIRRTAPHLLESAQKRLDHIYSDRGRIYGWLDRVLKTDGQLLVAKRHRGALMFNVEPSIFWTRYERLVDRYMARQQTKDDVQACADAGDEVRRLTQEATVLAFLDMHHLRMSNTLKNVKWPGWFKRLQKQIP